jgi:O-antigen/teichoic acid export membrane protein
MTDKTVSSTENRRSGLLFTALVIAVVVSLGDAFVYHPTWLLRFFSIVAAPGGIAASLLGLLMGHGHGPPPVLDFVLSLPFNFLVYAMLLRAFDNLVRVALGRKRRYTRSRT